MPTVQSTQAYAASDQGNLRICYAHGAARILLDAWRSVPHVTLPSFETMLQMIVRKFGVNGGNTRNVLRFFGDPQARQQQRDFIENVLNPVGLRVEDLADYYKLPRLCIRPEDVADNDWTGSPNMLCVFSLCQLEWSKLFTFYHNPANALKTLTKDDLAPQPGEEPDSNYAGHAVVIDSNRSARGRICLINSWGGQWGDKGRFYVASLDVLSAEVFRVWYTHADYQNCAAFDTAKQVEAARRQVQMPVLAEADVSGLHPNRSRGSGDNVIFTECLYRVDATTTVRCAVKRTTSATMAELTFNPVHPHVVTLYGYYAPPNPAPQGEVPLSDRVTSKTFYHIVMEQGDGDLEELLPPDLISRLNIMRDVAAALSHLATVGIIHRDVSPANILRFGDVWKLCDFGISRTTLRGTTSGTEGWSDPHQEVFLPSDGSIKEWFGWRYRPDRREQHKVDVYSLGQLMAFLKVEAFFPPGAKRRCQEPRLESRCSAADVLKWAEDALHQAAVRNMCDTVTRLVQDWCAEMSDHLWRDVRRSRFSRSDVPNLSRELTQLMRRQIATVQEAPCCGTISELAQRQDAEWAMDVVVTGPTAQPSTAFLPQGLAQLTIAPECAPADNTLLALSSRCARLRRLSVVRRVATSLPSSRTLDALFRTTSRLQFVDLSDCATVDDDALRFLFKRNHDLKHLNVQGCMAITDRTVERIVKHCRSMEYLNVKECPNITEKALLTMASTCAQLQRLDVTWCDELHTAALEDAIRRCKQLEFAFLKTYHVHVVTSADLQALAARCTELQFRNRGILPTAATVHIPDLDPTRFKVAIENRRWWPRARWDSASRLPTDRYEYTTADGCTECYPPNDDQRHLLHDEKWKADSPWRVEGLGSPDGWLYALDFPRWYFTTEVALTCVRRRIHVREFDVDPARTRNILPENEFLTPGQCLRSANRRHQFAFERNGNIVLYNDGKKVWSTGANHATEFGFTSLDDTQWVLVLRTSDPNKSVIYFRTAAAASPQLRLSLDDGGVLNLVDPFGVGVWSPPH